MTYAFPVIFAAFGSPLMLWGLAAASLPILIHLLNRRKFRETTWAAMSFLLAAIRKNQKRVRIEQWILLAVRTLLVALLALAMARPALESLSNLGLFTGRTHWVLALDSSMSMETRRGSVSRFEAAREAARKVVAQAKAGDGFSLIAMADTPRVIIGTPSFTKEAVLRAIDALRPTHGTHDPAASLRAIDEVLNASDIQRKDVVILSDFQRTSWETDATRGGDQAKTLASKLAAKSPRVSLVDVAGDADRNRAIVDLGTRPAFVTPGSAVEMRARVEAFGAAFPSGRARLVVDGRVIPGEEQQVPALEPGQHAELSFRHAFHAPGDSIVEVRLDGDAQPVDDHRTASVTVRDSIRVLLVDGDPRPGLFESDSAYLAEALSPEPESPGDPRPIAVQVVSEAQLARQDLSAIEVVVLCNVSRVGREAVDVLETFLDQGGGVVIFTGDQVQADQYNRVLFDGGKGLLPAQIGQAVGEASNRASPFPIETRGLTHPIVEDFQGQADAVLASLTNVKFYRYFRLAVPTDSPARVALGVAGDPLAVEVPRGRGRVVLFASTADRDWNDWPIHQSYPAVMERVVLQAAAGKLSERNVRVGEPLVAVLSAMAAGAEAIVTAPPDDDATDGGAAPAERITLALDGSSVHLETAPTERAGAYRVDFGTPVGGVARFAANPDRTESEMTRLDRDGLAAALPGLDFTLMVDSLTGNRSEGARPAGGELHRPLLWAVLALLLTETLLAWWFGNRAGLARAGE